MSFSENVHRENDFHLGKFLGSFWRATRGVLIQPRTFFAEISLSGSVRDPVIFAVVCFSVGGVLSLPLELVDTLPITRGETLREQGGFLSSALAIYEGREPIVAATALASMALIALAIVLARIYAFSGIVHLLAQRYLRGIRVGGFKTTLRVFCYASAVALLSWIPVLGFAATLYGLYLLVLGLRIVHERVASE